MRRRLRFLLITTFYPLFHFGGDAIHVRRLAHALARRGHQVAVSFTIRIRIRMRAVRGESPAAVGWRCIRPGVVPRSNTAGLLPRHIFLVRSSDDLLWVGAVELGAALAVGIAARPFDGSSWIVATGAGLVFAILGPALDRHLIADLCTLARGKEGIDVAGASRGNAEDAG